MNAASTAQLPQGTSPFWIVGPGAKYQKIVRYKKYPGETYYVYGIENTKQMLKDMLAFFDQYLKDDLKTSSELAGRPE